MAHDRALREWNYAEGRGNGSTWDGDEKQQEGSNQGRGEGVGCSSLGSLRVDDRGTLVSFPQAEDCLVDDNLSNWLSSS